jgi:hypothetical protein
MLLADFHRERVYEFGLSSNLDVERLALQVQLCHGGEFLDIGEQSWAPLVSEAKKLRVVYIH